MSEKPAPKMSTTDVQPLGTTPTAIPLASALVPTATEKDSDPRRVAALVDPVAAAHVQFHWNYVQGRKLGVRGTYPPDLFHWSLIDTMRVASDVDPDELIRLGTLYPNYAAAVWLIVKMNRVDLLREITDQGSLES